MKSLIPIIALVFTSTLGNGQSLVAGILPEFVVSKKYKNNFQISAKGATMHRFLETGQTPSFEYNHLQSDVQLFATYSVHPLWNFGFSYHYIYTNQHAHRAIQQVVYIQPRKRLKLAHRFRLDATVYAQDIPIYRLRYRISTEVPLQGQTLDEGEFYFLISDEPIAHFSKLEPELENRIGFAIGKLLLQKSKAELGIDYRTRSILNDLNHRAMIRIGWFVSM